MPVLSQCIFLCIRYIQLCSNIGELKRDLKEFEKKFRLIEIFKNKKDTDNSLVKNETKFFPDKNNNSELNTFLEKIIEYQPKRKNNKK